MSAMPKSVLRSSHAVRAFGSLMMASISKNTSFCSASHWILR